VTRRDFIIVGDAVRALPPSVNRVAVAERLAAAFEREYPRFDRVRFVNYCLNESAVSRALGAGGGES